MGEIDILILTAFFGSGHYSVARAVKEQILLEDPNLNVEIHDLFAITNPVLQQYAYDLYEFLTREMPDLYNFFYNKKRDVPDFYIDEITSIIGLQKFAEYIGRRKPSLIVSTFPLCSNVASRFKKKYGSDLPLVTCITDVVDSWEWISGETDMYLVPAECVRDGLEKKGVPPERINVSGIPLREGFCDPHNCGQKHLECGRNLADCGKVKEESSSCEILVMGGGRGFFEIEEEVFDSISQIQGVSIRVITGKNKELYEKLSSKRLSGVQVLGYVEDPASIMRESSIIITKPGGVTLFEAISCRTPIVCKMPAIGQEIQNAKFISDFGIGRVGKTNEELVACVRELAANPAEIERMKESMEVLKGTLSPGDTGRCILGMLAKGAREGMEGL